MCEVGNVLGELVLDILHFIVTKSELSYNKALLLQIANRLTSNIGQVGVYASRNLPLLCT